MLCGKNRSGNIIELESQKSPALKAKYKLIKSIAHLSVMLEGSLQSIHKNQELLKIKSLLTMLKNLDNNWLNNELNVINRMVQIIEKALDSTNEKNIQCLHAQFIKEIQPVNERYASLASDLQINGLHDIMSYWAERENIRLENSRVLIVCAKGPRKDLIEKQYFQWLYSEQGISNIEESGYLICVEMLPEQMNTITTSSLLDVLRKHEINAEIGKNMLGDSDAMNKDVLGQYAPDVLKKLCPLKTGFHHLWLNETQIESLHYTHRNLFFSRPFNRTEAAKINKLEQKIKDKLGKAHKEGKILLIIVGEHHYHSTSEQINNLIMTMCKLQFNMNILAIESPHVCIDDQKKAKHVNWIMVPVDKFNCLLNHDELRQTHPSLTSNSSYMEIRDRGMIDSLLEINSHALYIVGAAHLKGLGDSHELRKKFELLLVNGSDYHLSLKKHCAESEESKWFTDEDRVTQLYPSNTE
ncbi:MAG: hypothetical protein H0U70_01620 [Tatlockia sp.]|nr:hypothetical protein [Tatlockia sp.]